MNEADVSNAEKQGHLPLLERDQVTPELSAVYDKLMVERGVVPNMFKTVAHIPELAIGFAAFLKPLMGNGALTSLYKELVATRVALLNECEYCVSSHTYLARLAGASDAQVEGLRDYEVSPFTEAEKAGFRYADTMHISAHSVDDAVYEKTRRHFDDKQMIELTAVSAAFEFFPRFVNALKIPVTPLPQS